MIHPTTMRVKPAPGLVIRDPETQEVLPAAGAVVPRSGFWLRRLQDGDVVEAAPAAKTVNPAPEARAKAGKE